MIPFVFIPSVSSALLPHAAAEEKGASRGGHSGEGRLGQVTTSCLRLSQPCLHVTLTTSHTTSSPQASLPPNGRYILHRTGPGELHRFMTSRGGVSNNNRS